MAQSRWMIFLRFSGVCETPPTSKGNFSRQKRRISEGFFPTMCKFQEWMAANIGALFWNRRKRIPFSTCAVKCHRCIMHSRNTVLCFLYAQKRRKRCIEVFRLDKLCYDCQVSITFEICLVIVKKNVTIYWKEKTILKCQKCVCYVFRLGSCQFCVYSLN